MIGKLEAIGIRAVQLFLSRLVIASLPRLDRDYYALVEALRQAIPIIGKLPWNTSLVAAIYARTREHVFLLTSRPCLQHITSASDCFPF